jgi:hypothetical protein
MWVRVTSAWRVLWLWMEEWLPEMEGSCEAPEKVWYFSLGVGREANNQDERGNGK